MAIGVDIEDIDRFKNKSEEFIQRIFTAVEIDYCQKFSKPESHYAARFCAKEAVIKALTALKITNVTYNEIEVFHNSDKCPQIKILKDINRNLKFNLSLSHDKSKAIAFVTVEEQ